MAAGEAKPTVRVERYLRASVLNDVVELEKRVWKREGYREVNAPMLYFELAYLTNGLVLTAFDDGVYTTEERAVMAKEDPWYEGDHPIGFLVCFADFDHNGSFWYGARMGVDQRYQDKNIGEVLVSHLYDSAKEGTSPESAGPMTPSSPETVTSTSAGWGPWSRKSDSIITAPFSPMTSSTGAYPRTGLWWNGISARRV